MIVRVRKDSDTFICIHQHDHGLLAGELASRFQEPFFPYASTLYAIAYHDIGWESFDQQLSWNEKTGRPYDFDNAPLEEKIKLYQEGISRVEACYPYAGFLCSKHYASFFQHDQSNLTQKFKEQERIRQHQLRAHFTREEEQQIQRNFQLLQFFDDLSLALCLNEPTQNTHPWFQNGISLENKTYKWEWLDNNTLRLNQNIFKEEFEIELPYLEVKKDKQIIKRNKYRWKVKVF